MNVAFEEVLVNTPELVDEVINLTGQRRIPVIRSEQQFIVGFDREKLKALAI